MVAVNSSSDLGRTLASPQEKLSHDPVRYWGYLLLLVSLVLYAIEEIVDVRSDENDFALFFIHYILAVGYTFILMFHFCLGITRSWQKEYIHRTAIVLNLFLISAYALNREIPVFEQSTQWLCVYLIVTSATLLSMAWFEQLPRTVNIIQLIMLGSALSFYLYLAACCAAYYGIGAIGLIFFGIGGHVLVPIFMAVCTIALIIHASPYKINAALWAGLGVAITLCIVIVFVSLWVTRIKAIDKIENLSVLKPETELPVWVRVARTVEKGWVSERILKSDLVYKVSEPFSWSFRPNTGNWTERRVHDPLVHIASHFRKVSLPQEDRIRILESISDRHKAQGRLWSGDNLVTSQVVTAADIYTDLRLAYTEKYFSITNNINRSWRPEQEAIYTFQLPEGSVVTSLSLWVNGKEEKAILTSQQKATQAYNTVVGTERRDPSVVHWQEGNTVTVRVFPCTPDEPRKFKLGITSPLVEEDGRLHYRNINFRGPSAAGAGEVVQVRFIGNPQGTDLPVHFEATEEGVFQREQDYDPEWNVSFVASKMRSNYFSFDGFTYSMSQVTPIQETRTFSDLYLDINSSWTGSELRTLRPLITQYKVMVDRDDEFVQLTDDNWESLTSGLRENNFSIFPFHHIANPTGALVISKGEELSPFLADIEESAFAKEATAYFSAGNKMAVFNLSTATSTYIKSLRELRALDYASGGADELISMLEHKEYPVVQESDQRVVLHDSGIAITRTSTADPAPQSNAPDHLARLFAYNDIMRQYGPHFFDKDFNTAELVKEAASAYVVSPVSSLIVLETKEDYDRFGIEDSNNSLHNAMRMSSGAVPEPHEWALMGVLATVIIFCYLRQRRQTIITSK
jgi:XrtN system VIT domain protein